MAQADTANNRLAARNLPIKNPVEAGLVNKEQGQHYSTGTRLMVISVAPDSK